MKILVVSDSFKGTLSSSEIGSMVQEILQPQHQVDYLAVSDGGEGFIEAMQEENRGELRTLNCNDPLGRTILAGYLMIDRERAVVESAKVCGLGLLARRELNPMLTGTFGLGQMIIDAVATGARMLYVGLGGSATNDGGAGMLRALGVRFYDSNGLELHDEGGQILERIHHIDDSALPAVLTRVKICAVCDVDNPLLGSRGATMVYGSQKGASAGMLKQLEQGMRNFVSVAEKGGKTTHHLPGSGAAGGLGFAFRHFLNAEIVPGIEVLIREKKLNEKLHDYDLIITGEGKLDMQTRSGKVPMGILKLGQQCGKPVICLCGVNELPHNPGFSAIHAVVPRYATLDESISNPRLTLLTLLNSVNF